MTPLNVTFVNLALSSFRLATLAPVNVVLLIVAPVRLTPDRFVPLKVAPVMTR